MPIISLNPQSVEPKYQQIINAVISAVDNNQLKIGDKIDSVNEVCDHTGLAKKTVVQAFDKLKELGIIYSVKYKGYFVASRDTKTKHNIFTLFNEFTYYKEEIYESMKRRLDGKGSLDLYFHHGNKTVFNTLLEKSVGKYTEYIIIPPFDEEGYYESFSKLPKEKVYILDLGYQEWGLNLPSVCQYFEEDIYEAMKSSLQKIRKYNKIVLVHGIYPRYKLKYSTKGFKRFCSEYHLDCEVIISFKHYTPVGGELYITLDDHDLIDFMKIVNGNRLVPGRDIGIISYNEIPLKEVIGNGISTMSTDFSEMGRSIMDMILNKRRHQVKNSFRLIDRGSF